MSSLLSSSACSSASSPTYKTAMFVRGAFGDHDAPSTLLGVAVLGYPDQLVEVEAVAVTGGGFARA